MLAMGEHFAFVVVPVLIHHHVATGAAAARCALGRRALGVDYGLKRVGLAVSVGVAPRLLNRLDEQDATIAAKAVAAAANDHLAEEIVLGLPLNSAGEQGDQAERTLAFAKLVTQAAPHLPLVLLDERFTSAEADVLLQGRSPEERVALRDSVAAAGILERYFAPAGEALPIPFHTPAPSQQKPVSSKGGASQISFKEWREQRMLEARVQSEVMGLAKKGKRKRKGKR